MIIDKDTMLIEFASEDEVIEAEKYLDEVVWRGKIHPAPKFVNQWYVTCGLNETQMLLVMSTVLPARFAMSIAAYWKKVAKQGV